MIVKRARNDSLPPANQTASSPSASLSPSLISAATAVGRGTVHPFVHPLRSPPLPLSLPLYPRPHARPHIPYPLSHITYPPYASRNPILPRPNIGCMTPPIIIAPRSRRHRLIHHRQLIVPSFTAPARPPHPVSHRETDKPRGFLALSFLPPPLPLSLSPSLARHRCNLDSVNHLTLLPIAIA